MTPGIASREAARKWQFVLDRASWYEQAKCPIASGDVLGIITTRSKERERLASRKRSRESSISLNVTRDACIRPGTQVIGERDVVQVLQGILRRAQAGAGAGECFVPPRVVISVLRKAADFEFD